MRFPLRVTRLQRCRVSDWFRTWTRRLTDTPAPPERLHYMAVASAVEACASAEDLYRTMAHFGIGESAETLDVVARCSRFVDVELADFLLRRRRAPYRAKALADNADVGADVVARVVAWCNRELNRLSPTGKASEYVLSGPVESALLSVLHRGDAVYTPALVTAMRRVMHMPHFSLYGAFVRACVRDARTPTNVLTLLADTWPDQLHGCRVAVDSPAPGTL
jgi:hypothetical protein